MRTKHILTAMVLPALFAACTADEFTENGSNANLADRALLAPITFTVENGADTRFAWDEEGYGNWTWENTDAFSAFLVNNADEDPSKWTPTDYLLTNYVYTSKDGGSTYETTSNMVEGLYWFYAPARQGEGVESTQPMAFELATSQDAEYYKSDAAKVFFTGLYKLVAGNEPQNLPLSLTNFYSRAEFPLVNNTDEAITIRQIVLEASNAFVVKGKIATSKLNDYTYAFNEAGELVSARNLDNNAKNDETLDELKERLQEANDIVADDGKETASVIMLNLGDGVTLAKGARQSFTMLVPCTAPGVDCTIRIITDKGVASIAASSTSNYARNTQFVHNGLKPMFGFESDQKTFKAFSLTNDNVVAGSGNTYYVGSYEDMMKLISTVNGTFSAYNLGDWAVDAAMADALTNSDSYVKFLEPVTIESEEAVSVTKASFAEVTIKKGTTVTFDQADPTDVANAVSGTMTIEEGATVELNAGNFSEATVNNEGSLTVNAGAEMFEGNAFGDTKGITSTGVLKLVDNEAAVRLYAGTAELGASDGSEMTYDVGNGKIKLATADDLLKNKSNLTLTVAENVTLTVSAKRGAVVATANDGKTKYQTNIVNNGTISISATLTANGDLTNNGEISTTGSGNLEINGTATNAAEATIAKSTIGEDAVVTNSGTMSDVTNNGKITTVAGSHTAITSGTGTIDNTAKADVSGTVDGLSIEYVYTGAVDLNDADTQAEIAALNATYSVDKLVFKGAVSADNTSSLSIAGIEKIDFENGSSLKVGGEGDHAVTFADVTAVGINGNVTFSGFDTENNSKINFSTACIVTVAKNYTLTITNVTVSGASGQLLTFKGEEPGADDPATTKQGQVINGGAVNYATEAYAYDAEDMPWWSGNAASTTGN